MRNENLLLARFRAHAARRSSTQHRTRLERCLGKTSAFAFALMLACQCVLLGSTMKTSAQSMAGASLTAGNGGDESVGVASVVAPSGLFISEFRLFGLNGANDEFVEIYNNSDLPLTVSAPDGSSGFALAASDGVVRFTIPNGTRIPARGHYLGVNALGYSLATYPAGNNTAAVGDAFYTTDIPANAGIALFNTSNPLNFSTATRFDAVGSTLESNSLYKEGAGYQQQTTFAVNQSLWRKLPGGCHGYAGNVNDDCLSADAASTTAGPTSAYQVDTNDNQSDFLLVATSNTTIGGQRRLGAPGPEGLSSPTTLETRALATSNLDPNAAASSSPNRVRDLAGDAGSNSTFGTIDIRKTFTNNTGANITRLRFRIVDITTFPARGTNCFPGSPDATDCVADLRAITSTTITVSTSQGDKTVEGTTLEEATPAPANQPNGGGYNSSLSAGSISLLSPLEPGESINLRFLLGVQQTGKFRFFVNFEALP